MRVPRGPWRVQVHGGRADICQIRGFYLFIFFNRSLGTRTERTRLGLSGLTNFSQLQGSAEHAERSSLRSRAALCDKMLACDHIRTRLNRPATFYIVCSAHLFDFS